MAKIRPDEKRQYRNIIEKFEGQRPDSEYAPLPAWHTARNLWVDSGRQIHSRPFYVPVSGAHDEIQGMFYDSGNQLVYIADGTLYRSFTPEAAVDITAPLRFDISRMRTVVATGGTPFVWIGPGEYFPLPYQNVKALAAFVGVQKLRLAFTTYDDPHRLYITEIGDLTDTGTVIVDPRGIANDEWTEGFSIKNLPYEIVDICELNGMVLVIHKRGMFSVQPGVNENGFYPDIRERIDTEFLDVRACRDEGQIHLLGPEGPKRIYFNEGFPTFSPYPLVGIEKTIQNALIESEAAISVDAQRGLMFIKPNDGDDTTYVWHFKHQFWTEWDGGINDAISVAGTTYVSLEGGDHLYKLDDEGNNSIPVEIEMKTGITPILDEGLRKRLRYGHIHFDRLEGLEFYSESIAEVFLETVLPAYAEVEDSRETICYMGDQGELFCMAFCFRTRRRLTLNQLVIEFLVKHPRLLN